MWNPRINQRRCAVCMNIGWETEEVEFKKTTGELKECIFFLAPMLNKKGGYWEIHSENK